MLYSRAPVKELFVIAICLALNAAIAAFEMAFVSIRKSELRQLARKGSKRASALLELREHPERPLSVLQIGINLVGALSAAVGGAGAEEALSPWIERTLHVSEPTGEAIALAMVVLPLTYVTVVVGELVPKSFALRHARPIALAGLPVLRIADRLLSPLVSLLEGSTHLITRIVPSMRSKVSDAPGADGAVDLTELSSQNRQYVVNMFKVETKRVRDVMVPWNKVVFARDTDDMEGVKRLALACRHTRLPVLVGRRVVGILHTKEFMSLLHAGETSWHQILRAAHPVRDDEFALPVLKQMQEKTSHMMVAYDARENVVGVVTMEDVIEEIVGDIADEDDDGRIRRILANAAHVRRVQRER